MLEIIIIVVLTGIFFTKILILRHLKILTEGSSLLIKNDNSFKGSIDQKQLEIWEDQYIDLFRKQLA
ncbi:hypothetical protein [Fuchsiella alkaliacetigena]|uniref:hypothetical protein n=1 Tax=Fuchsiella alkaliacetigena TaxID=957042 RepID=UPI00200AAC21|nr:hypothetical protein [Fuchsiella alkaliacetigena]MCK8824984.1 hypothetical protein [Fuchsiella alkaliacetigena]